MVGQTVSHYRILAKLGEGGMGVVYKAEDTRLKRTVALKFLPETAIEEPETRTRFLQEAQAAAALSHSNVCTVYEMDEERGFLVMEFVEGETIQARVRRRPLPLAEALDLAMQAAQGLQAAHERGIVHRDIKSANLMVTPPGTVKIMDFGLARLTDRTRVTRTGTMLGTPAYMSPEQAQGKETDRRTDLWSLGVVLYEMVTGQSPFRGESMPAVVHSILNTDPEPVTALRAGLPLELDRVIGKALSKDPGERYQHAEDFLVDLRAVRGSLQMESKAQRLAAAAGRRRGMMAAALLALIPGIAIGVLWNWTQTRKVAQPPVVRFNIDLPEGQFFRPTWNSLLTFSPDGGTLAYSTRASSVSMTSMPSTPAAPAAKSMQAMESTQAMTSMQPMTSMQAMTSKPAMESKPAMTPMPSMTATSATYLRSMNALEPRLLTDAPNLGIPVFSPDGRYLLLQDSMTQEVKKAAVSGGAPVPFATADFVFRGDWAPDNYYYWTTHYFGPIVRTPASGGKPEPVTELDLEKQERTHRHAQMLPGGKALIFTVSHGGIESFNDAHIDAYTLSTKKRKTLVEGGFAGRYSPSGHIVYARGGNLYAVPFNADRLEVTGSPVKVAEEVFMSTNTGSAYFDVSRAGALAYAEGKTEGGERTLVWVDRKGNATPLPLPPRSYLFPRISPDGALLAFEVEGVNHDLYTYDPDRGVTTKMTTDGVSHAPVWSADGKRLAFRSWKAGTMTMWWMPADRSGPEERLTSVGARQNVVSFSPDGGYMSYTQMEPGKGTGIWMLPLKGERTPVPFIKAKSMDGAGRFSPDGKWVVYCSPESGRAEVYVQPWPGPGPKIQISSEGGTDPVWSRDGKELFYRNGDKMMVVAVSVNPTFRASRPAQLWEGKYSHGMSSSCGMPGATEANYDVSADGQRFLMVKDLAQDTVSKRIVVVVNFAQELKGLARADSK